ncbi:MAG TPA: amidohydrolase family protein, partial [Phycisphaerae bacterium]|nr:amidohydrolase family protein [Phycisphaerae bacterium]
MESDMARGADGDIVRQVFASPLADTHNHLFPEAKRCGEQHDFTLFFDGYAASVLRRCGMPQEELAKLGDEGLSAADKWRILEPYWGLARVTGVMRPQLWAMRDLFDADELNAETAERITEEIRRTNRPGRSREILHDKANLHHVQICSAELYPTQPEQEGFYLYDLGISGLINGSAVGELEQKTGRAIDSLDRHLEAVDWCFEQYGRQAVGLKDGNCYRRPLNYTPTRKGDAERAFRVVRKGPDEADSLARRPFEDFVYHHCLAKAEEYALPIRSHIGYTAGISPQECNHACHMEPILASHPNLRFILLHAGYPFADETVGLCMAYPNACADLGWIWQLDPVWSEAFVRRFVTSVGPRQLLLFGGDTGFAEVTYGYSRVARQGLALALTRLREQELIEDRDVDLLIERLTVENAR